MTVNDRVEELLSSMTLPEKAGQLIQYFSFGPTHAAVGPAEQQPGEVEGALARGGVGSLLFVTDPAEVNRLQRLVVEGSRHRSPAVFG
ncbi:MAG TPA: beta-glucosidase, partial [Actinomycetes bacterium]|nr:beta-glucosidase [Actinomycetes bacterium]